MLKVGIERSPDVTESCILLPGRCANQTVRMQINEVDRHDVLRVWNILRPRTHLRMVVYTALQAFFAEAGAKICMIESFEILLGFGWLQIQSSALIDSGPETLDDFRWEHCKG